jgi:hypothetical protein
MRSAEELLELFHKVHFGKYEYPDFSACLSNDRIVIRCREHGEWTQRLSKHLEGQGCKKCAGRNSSTKWENPTGFRDEQGVQVQYREYTIWRAMLQRSKPAYWEKHKHYTDTKVSENFRSWDYFKRWWDAQFNSNFLDEHGKPFELDKDILSCEGKLYSEDTCCFIPRRLNEALGNKQYEYIRTNLSRFESVVSANVLSNLKMLLGEQNGKV